MSEDEISLCKLCGDTAQLLTIEGTLLEGERHFCVFPTSLNYFSKVVIGSQRQWSQMQEQAIFWGWEQKRIHGSDCICFFTMILFNSQNSICTRPICHPLFCHSTVVKYSSFL